MENLFNGVTTSSESAVPGWDAAYLITFVAAPLVLGALVLLVMYAILWHLVVERPACRRCPDCSPAAQRHNTSMTR